MFFTTNTGETSLSWHNKRAKIQYFRIVFKKSWISCGYFPYICNDQFFGGCSSDKDLYRNNESEEFGKGGLIWPGIYTLKIFWLLP